MAALVNSFLSTPMISGQKNIASVFSLLHDGVIASHLSGNDGLVLIIDIPYLARRIDPSFTKFLVCLFGINDIRFHAWPNGVDHAAKTLTSLDEIFQAKLAILHGDLCGDAIEVACNQTSLAMPHGGGELQFQADSATVSDETGKFWSIEQLDELSKGYWDDWAASGGKKG